MIIFSVYIVIGSTYLLFWSCISSWIWSTTSSWSWTSSWIWSM